MQTKKFTTEFAEKPLEAEFSDLAMHANGSVTVRYGKTVVFAAATMGNEKPDLDYFPLSVNYEEKFYATGQILGSRFLRREGKPSEEAVLTGRLIDRTIRPLFNGKLRKEVQVVIMVLALDGENDPDIPGIIAASLALGTSDIPWSGPVGAVSLGMKDDAIVLNPPSSERENGLLNMVVCAKSGKINMIEAGAKEVPEEKVVEGFNIALAEIEKIENFQKEIIKEIGRAKQEIKTATEPEGFRELFEKHIYERLNDYIYKKEKTQRYEALNELKQKWMEVAVKQYGEDVENLAGEMFESSIDDIVHKNILEKDLRPDSRGLKEIRTLYADAGILPRTHGSAVFYRGETHIMSVATLGGPDDYLVVEGMEVQGKKRFMHHYNFPPFSSGETGRMGTPGRREIGHGALAERALEAVIPDKEKFPYTIRLVSETMSSNGSTSMGSACASCLALMDAGVPISEPVAGMAMGLMLENPKSETQNPKYKILTDIQGPEDHHGDMDFKSAGTKNGITAIQMDVKVDGIPVSILSETLSDARDARMKILNEVMVKVLDKPRDELPEGAPRIITMQINPEKIRDLIGPGGKTINSIIEKTGADVNVEQTGVVFITGKNEKSAKDAKEAVKLFTKEFKTGDTTEGVVSRIFDFGAMVEIAPGQEGLVHISELAQGRTEKVTDVVNIGDLVKVKVLGIDEKGRINLSIKALS